MSQNTEALITMLKEREQRGIAKYGVTLDRTDLSPEQWLQHAIEELLDGAAYMQGLKRTLRASAAPPVAQPVAKDLPDAPGLWFLDGNRWASIERLTNRLAAGAWCGICEAKYVTLGTRELSTLPRGNWLRAQPAPPVPDTARRAAITEKIPSQEELERLVVEPGAATDAVRVEELTRLREFKRLTHDALDSMGVPACYDAHVPCRIGERLQRLAADKQRLEAELERVKKERDEAIRLVDEGLFAASDIAHTMYDAVVAERDQLRQENERLRRAVEGGK